MTLSLLWFGSGAEAVSDGQDKRARMPSSGGDAKNTEITGIKADIIDISDLPSSGN